MKNILLSGLILGLFFTIGTNEVFAASTQQITLRTGWNIISTPKVLESHSFSTAETSDNFDIFLLDPSKSSGWATMSDLGHNTFVPLYGYFIQNKTGSNQTLTFNHKNDVSISERFFERIFSRPGWYSIGIANSDYATEASAPITDVNNPSQLLNSLNQKYNLVVDFTNAAAARTSVKLTDPWLSAIPSDINSLKDFRETKGYAIYVTQSGAQYIGLQTANPSASSSSPQDPGDNSLSVQNTVSTPSSKILKVNPNSTSDEYHVFSFNLKTGSQSNDLLVTKIPINITTSSSTLDITNVINDIWVGVNSVVLRDYTLTATSVEFAIENNNILIANNDTQLVEVYVKFNRQSGNYPDGTKITLSVDSEDITVRDLNNNPAMLVGSATSKEMTLATNAATIDGFTWKVSKANNGNSGTITFRFTVDADDEDFTLRQDSLVAITTGTATSTGPTWSRVSGDATPVTGGYTINSGDSATFEVTYNINSAGTKAVSVTSVANRNIPNDKQYSGLEVF